MRRLNRPLSALMASARVSVPNTGHGQGCTGGSERIAVRLDRWQKTIFLLGIAFDDPHVRGAASAPERKAVREAAQIRPCLGGQRRYLGAAGIDLPSRYIYAARQRLGPLRLCNSDLRELFEVRPRAILYAAVATTLSLIGSFIQPLSEASMIVVEANRLIAVLTQWLSAALVGLQQRRLVEANDKAEFQHRFVDILSHEIGTALTAVTGQAYRLTKLSEELAPGDLRLRAEKIRKAAERIEAIIDRVQFASSLGDGTIPIGNEFHQSPRLDAAADGSPEGGAAGRIDRIEPVP